MKRLLLASVALGVVLGGLGLARAGTIVFDESGKGTNNGVAMMTSTFQGTLLTFGPPLAYDLGTAAYTLGQAQVIEVVNGQGNVSDYLEWAKGTGGSSGTLTTHTYLIVLSDEGDPLAADQGLPTNPNNPISLQETGTEAANGVTYTPNSGQPGFVSGETTTYQFTSDVPEPGTVAMLTSLGLSAAGFLRRKRSR